jgi:hypothetical protein
MDVEAHREKGPQNDLRSCQQNPMIHDAFYRLQRNAHLPEPTTAAPGRSVRSEYFRPCGYIKIPQLIRIGGTIHVNKMASLRIEQPVGDTPRARVTGSRIGST